MNEFTRYRRGCQLGIKVFQNLRASLSAFERLCNLTNSDDHILLSSYFHIAVIRYAKPFLNTNTLAEMARYPTKKLKLVPGFSSEIHDHLIKMRNTLIAHDDFEQIEPRILSFGITPHGTDNLIPTSMVIANKCISHPSDLNAATKFQDHVKSALSGITAALHSDITMLRSVSIKHPEQAKAFEKYSEHYGSIDIPKNGKRLEPPNFMNDPWLNIPEPDFSEIHNGFRYERISVKQDFHGPETIQLPNGSSIELSP